MTPYDDWGMRDPGASSSSLSLSRAEVTSFVLLRPMMIVVVIGEGGDMWVLIFVVVYALSTPCNLERASAAVCDKGGGVFAKDVGV